MTQFDLAGAKITEIMQGRDLVWLDPPNPVWRIEPPTFLRWLLRLGWRARDYDQRLQSLIASLLEAHPGSYLLTQRALDGLGGDWKPADLGKAPWKDAESGSLIRGLSLEGAPCAYRVPANADVASLTPHLADGGWALWQPKEDKKGIVALPRLLAQDSLKTVQESELNFLAMSWWDNAFTEVALNPSLGGEQEAA